MTKLFRFGLLLTGIAIALNAVGYHALQPHLDAKQLSMYETASRYSLFGGLWFLVLGSAQTQFLLSKKGLILIQTGLTLFCGSLFLYLLYPLKFLMFITPIGGLCLIIGFVVCAFQKSK